MRKFRYMKISYERTVPITPTLTELRAGEIFRPTNSERVFVRTNGCASDEFTSDREAPIRKLFDDLQQAYTNDDDLDCEELVFCVDMETGKLILLHSNLKVEKLIGELMIKER